MSKRAICAHCHYPLGMCVCDAITPMPVPARLLILQHPHETKHAKNTVRLIKLCVPECDVVIGESADDFFALQNDIAAKSEDVSVIYPHPKSMAIEHANSTLNFTPPSTLILIDATWRKAHKMWQLNPWLHILPSWHFNVIPQADYRIRKSKLAHSLSTLEATSLALQHLYQVDTQPLMTLFEAMQQNTERFTPNHPRP